MPVGGPSAEAVEVVPVALRRLDPDLPLPAYAQPGDAGADLLARHDVQLPPGGRATVATGVAVALPEGYAAFVHPRSGLAARHGVTTLNGPGTVDAGYRGEVLVTLVNTDRDEAFSVRRGDRIAQLVVQRVARATFAVVDELPGSPRGERGHGSTGGWTAAAPGAGGPASATLGAQVGGTGGPPGDRVSTAPASTTTAPAGTTAAGRTETTAGGPRAAGEEQP